nr:InfA [Zehneria sp. PEBO4401]
MKEQINKGFLKV